MFVFEVFFLKCHYLSKYQFKKSSIGIKERRNLMQISNSPIRLCVKISVADPGCLSRIPDPDFYPSRIRVPDPKTATKERAENKFIVIPLSKRPRIRIRNTGKNWLKIVKGCISVTKCFFSSGASAGL
jgi:hypothetical protein